MRGRFVSWAFFAGALLCGALLVTDSLRASKPGVKVPDVHGHWDGFFLEAGAAPGFVISDVTQWTGRRLAGRGRLVDGTTGDRLASYTFNGSLPTDDILTAEGRTAAGRVAIGAGLHDYAGGQGNAVVLEGKILLTPRRGPPSMADLLLLRPFPDAHAADPSGTGLGTFRSALDPTFTGGLVLEIGAADRGAFPGTVTFNPLTSRHAGFSWHSRATLSTQGRIILIAQGKTGRMVVDGAVRTRATGAAVDGLYTLISNDGRRDIGFYNFNIKSRVD